MHTRTMSCGAHIDQPEVLVIDDDMVSREVTATLLTLSGSTVHTAADGASALALLAGPDCHPAIIVMDAHMPGLSGIELLAELRARSQARIYLVSGSNPSSQLIHAADGFLLKPFDSEALASLLAGEAAPAGASFLEPDEPVVSAEILRQFRQMMPEPAVRQIYAAMVDDLKQRLALLEAAIGRKDAAEVHRIGHAIKGGCSMAGAQQAARLGALLEAMPLPGEGNYMDNSAALLRDLRAAAVALERMLEAELPA